MNNNYGTESVSVTVFPGGDSRAKDEAYQIVAGGLIVAQQPHQPLPPQLLGQSQEDIAAHLCADAALRGNQLERIMRHAVRDLPGETEIELAEPKLLCRAFRKASVEKGNDATRVLDYCRGTIWLNTPEQIIAVCNYFRPCNNPAVVSFVDQFASPDPKNNLRRLKVVIDLGGHLAEIQVLHAKVEETYRQTRVLYGLSRAISEDLQSRDLTKMEPETLRACMKKVQHFDHKRIRMHEDAAKACDLEGLREQRRYSLRANKETGIILPVAEITGGTYVHPQGRQTLIVPFAAANRYVQMHPLDMSAQLEGRISRNDFLDISAEMVNGLRVAERGPRAAVA